VRNLGPAPQPFSVSDPIPANTTYVSGNYYNAATNSIEWSGTVGANKTLVTTFAEKVNVGTPSRAAITNTATLCDDASGSSATVTTKVK
jgi:hypothetical protein